MRALVQAVILLAADQVVVGAPFQVSFDGLTVNNPFATFRLTLMVDGAPVAFGTYRFLDNPPVWTISIATAGGHEVALEVFDESDGSSLTVRKTVLAVERTPTSWLLPAIIFAAGFGLLLGAAASRRET